MKIQHIPAVYAGMNFLALFWIFIIAPDYSPQFETKRMYESLDRLDSLMANSPEKDTPNHRQIRTVHNMLRSHLNGMEQVAESEFVLYERVQVPLYILGILN